MSSHSLGLPARDVDVDQAARHILGYTLLNDFRPAIRNASKWP